jgi:hypothetical protein
MLIYILMVVLCVSAGRAARYYTQHGTLPTLIYVVASALVTVGLINREWPYRSFTESVGFALAATVLVLLGYKIKKRIAGSSG